MRAIKFGFALAVLVLFAQSARETRANDQSPSSGNLSRVHRSVWPEARGYAHLLSDPIRERVLLVGGESYAGGPSLPGFGGVWAFNAHPGRWSYITDLPVDAVDLAAFDEREDKLIVYYSYLPDPTLTTPLQLDYKSETWAFDFRTATWRNLQPSQTPPPGLCACGAQAAYDSRAGKTIMFGGLDLPGLDQCLAEGCDDEGWFNLETNNTWVYDYRENLWTLMPRPADESQLPPRRNSHGLTYDRHSHRVILFGGGDFFGDSPPDTWAFDLLHNTWTNLLPAVSPPKGEYFKLAYDRASRRTVFFGGLQYDGVNETLLPPDTWAYDFNVNAWELKSPALSPGARAWHAWAYDVKAQSLVLFGGGIDRYDFTDETWVYRTFDDTWRQVPKR